MIGALLAGLAAGYGIAIPVGAVAVLIVETGIRSGFRAAAAAGAGAASADGIYAAIAAVCGVALAGVLAPWQVPLRAAAIVVLVGLGLRGFRSVAREAEVTRGREPEAARVPGPVQTGRGLPASPGEPASLDPVPRPLRRIYAAFLGITLLNPMTITYFAALILGLGGTGSGAAEKIAFVAGAFSASLSWQLLIAAAGAALHQRLAPRLRLAVGVVGNVIVLAFAAVIAVGLAR
jgi:arginine exporter protein ArgO